MRTVSASVRTVTTPVPSAGVGAEAEAGAGCAEVVGTSAAEGTPGACPVSVPAGVPPRLGRPRVRQVPCRRRVANGGGRLAPGARAEVLLPLLPQQEAHHREADEQDGTQLFDGHGHRSSVGRYRRLSDGGPEGTGSYPPGCHGWQRAMRRTASHEPRSGP